MNFNTNEIILGLVLAMVFYFVILPKLSNNTEKMAPVALDESNKTDLNQCSRSCCKHSQWPVPHMKLGNQIKDDNVSTNLMCNHGQGGGCVCVSKNNYNYLTSRGNNTML